MARADLGNRVGMATRTQMDAATRNRTTAGVAARSKRTLAPPVGRDGIAEGEPGAAPAIRKRAGAATPRTRREFDGIGEEGR